MLPPSWSDFIDHFGKIIIDYVAVILNGFDDVRNLGDFDGNDELIAMEGWNELVLLKILL